MACGIYHVIVIKPNATPILNDAAGPSPRIAENAITVAGSENASVHVPITSEINIYVSVGDFFLAPRISSNQDMQ